MRKIICVLLFLAVAYVRFASHAPQSRGPGSTGRVVMGGDAAITALFQGHESNVQVQGSGTVIKVLRDDTEGIEHQKFLLRLASGQTILIAHNIDIAGRIEGLKTGDTVEFAGEYVWDAQGGLVHWTHSDPQGRHAAGWLKCNGRTYQ